MNKTLYSFDTKNLFTVLKDSWQQAESAWKKIDLSGIDIDKIDNIIVTGLGGSAISGDILKNFLNSELKKPLIINRTYHLPPYAGRNTLVITSSYSGNTEETISAFKSAVERGCRIIALTTGGEIEKLAALNKIPVVKLQNGFQPRYALYNSFFTLLRVMQELKFVDSQEAAVVKIIQSLKKLGQEWSSEDGDAFKFAGSLKGYVPVIYSVTDLNDSAGKRFKGQLNENSKLHAWIAEYPEMNHNEIVGWESAKESGLKYKVVTIWDDEIFSRIRKRIEIINKLLDGEKIDILKIQGKGDTFKERLLEIVYFCDWVSYYLALLNEKDPGEIDFIHHLKNKMAEG
ncbi:MAG TPA: bifunctional phosphoglucose/phosphomannose isomerase [Spirochaetota bacterium]|nr:bifunctional phosphoglucose/phosphomannose isomerase [Spirochaetota bacterium]HPS86499.1 bifunctional phosphoglucose/phosphomannose isomerase [Spirochaetota bacterium]